MKLPILNRDVYLKLYCQWCNPFRCHWIDFDFIHVGFEWSRMGGPHEAYAGLLGVKIHVDVYRRGALDEPKGTDHEG